MAGNLAVDLNELSVKGNTDDGRLAAEIQEEKIELEWCSNIRWPDDGRKPFDR